MGLYVPLCPVLCIPTSILHVPYIYFTSVLNLIFYLSLRLFLGVDASNILLKFVYHLLSQSFVVLHALHCKPASRRNYVSNERILKTEPPYKLNTSQCNTPLLRLYCRCVNVHPITQVCRYAHCYKCMLGATTSLL